MTPDGGGIAGRSCCLLVAPDPQHAESPISWVQRVCGAHFYSMRRLAAICGEKNDRLDWDVSSRPRTWAALLELSRKGSHVCGEARFAFDRLATRKGSRKGLLLRSSKLPAYRWCGQCLGTDEIPYLRWQWRLAEVTHCDVHRTALWEACPWCDAPLVIGRALLVSAGSMTGVADLSICAQCGMSLTTARESESSGQQDDVYKLMTPYDSLLDSLRSGYRQYQLDLERTSHDVPLATKKRAESPKLKVASIKQKAAPTEQKPPSPAVEPPPSKLDMIKSLHRWADELRKRPFRWSMHDAVPRYPPSWCIDIESTQKADRRPRWSDRLTPGGRVLLAKALVIIRREKNLMRRAALAGEPTMEGR